MRTAKKAAQTARYYRVSSVHAQPAEVRFAVTVLGAREGDWLIVRPWHATRPIIVQRSFDAELLPVLDACIPALEFLEES